MSHDLVHDDVLRHGGEPFFSPNHTETRRFYTAGCLFTEMEQGETIAFAHVCPCGVRSGLTV